MAQDGVSAGSILTFTTGEGNLSDNPRLINPLSGDFTLASDSPAINSGDPATELDPDGTRADMGWRPDRFDNGQNYAQTLVLDEPGPYIFTNLPGRGV